MDRDLEVKTLTREDLQSWHSDPITRIILSEIQRLVKDAHLSLGGGEVLDADKPENTAQNYAKMVGYIAGLRVILNIEVSDDIGETSDNA